MHRRVPGYGGKTCKGCDLFAGHGADFRALDQNGHCGDGTKTGDRAKNIKCACLLFFGDCLSKSSKASSKLGQLMGDLIKAGFGLAFEKRLVTTGEIFMIHDLHRQGLSIRAIARQTGRSRKTIRKYLKAGLEPPAYKQRDARPGVLDRFKGYLRERLRSYPGLSAQRLTREIAEQGYSGGYSTVKRFVRENRPTPQVGFEHRFETLSGEQVQVDFAHFNVRFSDEANIVRVVWLFSLVLGHSCYLFARFVLRQTLEEVVRCHMAAFNRIGRVPRQILYDRMKTAVTGEDDEGRVLFNKTLLDLAGHYHFTPKACRPYRAKTKGKVERPFRYIRQDFFLGRTFRNLVDLNRQLEDWLDNQANRRRHGTTGRVVAEAFAGERAGLQPLPEIPFNSVLTLERRITRDGMVSVGGNLYSVPDGTRRRAAEVHALAEELLIYEDGHLIARHPVLPGRGRRSLLAGHRRRYATRASSRGRDDESAAIRIEQAGDAVWQRPLDVYDDLARGLARSLTPGGRGA